MRVQPEAIWSPEIIKILDEISALANHLNVRVYLVGGPVRDLLLERETLDLDIAVEGEVSPLAEALAQQLHGQVTGHQQFGTATVTWDSPLHVDLASTRKETYPEPAILPEVQSASLVEDLWRRDFTIHAMALPLAGLRREIIDPTGGKLDLQLRSLRGLHPRTFNDDPTRIVRAARYAAVFELTIEPETMAWLRTAVHDGLLRRLSGPRVWGELQRTLQVTEYVRACEMLWAWGVLSELGLEYSPALLALDQAPHNKPKDRVLAALGLLAGPAAEAVAKNYDLSHSEREAVHSAARLAAAPPPVVFAAGVKNSTLQVVLQTVPAAGLLALWAAHAAARPALEHWWAGAPWQADITGDDLLAVGYDAGPDFREALQAALDAKLDDGADRERQLQVARRILEQSPPRDP